MITLVGILLVLLGVVMVCAPFYAGMASVIVVGCLLGAGGIFECMRAFHERSTAVRLSWLVVGGVTVLGAFAMLAHPLFGLGILTLLLAAYFLAGGVVKIVAAFQHPGGRGWLLGGGAISVLLGILLWANWPLSGVWAIGTLVGIDTLFTGLMMLMVGRALKKLAEN